MALAVTEVEALGLVGAGMAEVGREAEAPVVAEMVSAPLEGGATAEVE